MVDKVSYALHLKHLFLIKGRDNQYPSYSYIKNPSNFKKSDKQIQMNQIRNEIQSNIKNIKEIKRKTSPQRRPANYDYEEYFLQREIENMQKQQIKGLINKNKNLKNKLENIKNSNSCFRPDYGIHKRSGSVIK